MFPILVRSRCERLEVDGGDPHNGSVFTECSLMNSIPAAILWVTAALTGAVFLAPHPLQAQEPARTADRVECLIRSLGREPTELALTELSDKSLIGADRTGAVTLPLSGVWRVECPWAKSRPVRPRFRVHFSNGDRLGVEAVLLSDEKVTLMIGAGLPPVSVPLESVTGVQPLDERGTWRTDDPQWLRISRLKAESDAALLINGDRVVGEVTQIDAKSLTITSAGTDQNLPWETLVGLRMNPDLTTVPPRPASGWVVLFADESWLTVSSLIVPLSESASLPRPCRMKWLDEIEVSLAWDTVRSLDRIDPRSIPLDSILPLPLQSSRNAEGLPPRFSQDHDPLVPTAWPVLLAPQGCGLHGGWRAEWDIAPDWESLHFGCGIDATACSQGHATLRVIVDGQPLLERVLIAGTPPEWPPAVPLSGAKRLRVEVDAGPEGEPCDLVNLIAPRIGRQ